MKKRKILFVLTSTARLGDSGHHTGAYLSEITHPYEELSQKGYKIDMVSPEGGKVPLDGVKMDDPINAVWMNDDEFLQKIEHTMRPWQINADDYDGILFVGGHGAIFDFPENQHLQRLAMQIYEKNGVIGGLCHGVAGLINVRLSDGSYLLRGHEISSFTNDEEIMVGMEHVVPFLLEDKVKERGARHTSSPKFAGHVVKSGRIVTGQNPASASGVGKAMAEVLEFIEEGRPVPDENWCEWHRPSPKNNLTQRGLT